MQMLNFTPFPNLRFYNTDPKGREFGVVIVKGTFAVDAEHNLVIAQEQAPILLSDKYHGEPNRSSLWIPSDLVPAKPRTDIVLNAVARAPLGQPLPSWIAGIRIFGEQAFGHAVRVTGPRFWLPRWAVSQRARSTMDRSELRRVFNGWIMGEPTPTHEVPIRYELAFGGVITRPGPNGSAPRLEALETNPIGRGWIDEAGADLPEPIPAPQIEDVRTPVADPSKVYAPAGLGPIPPAWLPRRPLAGTFDEHWKANIWPSWPEDYSFAYHNSANPSLVHPSLLAGDEIIELHGLRADPDPIILVMSGDSVSIALQNRDGSVDRRPMALDTLLLDVADDDPLRHRVFLSWRTTYDPDAVLGASFTLKRPDVFERAARQSARLRHVH